MKHKPQSDENMFYMVQVKHFFVVMCSVITVLYNLITKGGHQRS